MSLRRWRRRTPGRRDILDGQERLFAARAAARAGEVAQFRERIGQAQEEIAGLEAQAASLQEQVGLVDRELEAQRTLFDKQLTRLDRLLAVERAAEDLKGRMGSVTASIARARGRIAEYEIQILQIDTGHIEQAEAQARDVQGAGKRGRGAPGLGARQPGPDGGAGRRFRARCSGSRCALH